MALNLLIGGAAGQGIDTTAAIVEKLLKQAGYHVYTTRDFMSRVRGGHNFILIRFGSEVITSHSDRIDGLVALNEETVELHRDRLTEQGFILCDSGLQTTDDRVLKIDMKSIAKDLGNPRAAGSVAIGALLRLFSLDLKDVRSVMPRFIPEKHVEINVQAAERGFQGVNGRFTEPTGTFKEWMLISGNRALALGALAADVRFFSAYPMSPSTTIMEFLAEHGKTCDVVVEQAEDEIAAINMAIGASFAGVRAMTATSGGGFALMTEALGLAGIGEIPLVICDIQRPGPATGLPTRTEQSDLKFVVSASQGEFPRMVIALRNHTDAYLQTIRAFHLAERYRIPVILLSDQYLADASVVTEPFSLSDADLARESNDNQQQAGAGSTDGYKSYRLTQDGITPRAFPGHPAYLVSVDSDEHDEHGRITESSEVRNQMVDKRMRKLDKLKSELQEPILVGSANPETLLIGWGSMHGPLTEAVAILNREKPDSAGALVFGDIYPLPAKRILELSLKAGRLVNVEQNATGQLAGLIREHTGLACADSILKFDGRQLSGEEIALRLKEVSR